MNMKHYAKRSLGLAAALWCLALAGGCVIMPGSDPVSYAPTLPPQPEMRPVTSGAIYQTDLDVRLFEDIKARRVGDMLTIELVERTIASKSASTSTSKDTQVDNTAPTLLGRPVTVNGTEVLVNTINAEQSFDGEGSSSQSNRLEGSITVTVEKVLPNGYLMVRGEKLVTLNRGEEYVQLSGIVRPTDIGPRNQVQSDRVADARIVYSGRGEVADASTMGWLARFFNSKWVPF